MPSSQTLTEFYIFSAGSIARAEDVNVNFNAFRGHLLPVDPTLAAAATTKTYDLGSSDHRWGVGYFSKLDISITSTSQMIAEGLSAGAWNFLVNSISIFKITDDGFIGANQTPLSVQNPTATVGNIAARATINTTITTSGHIANTTCTLQTIGRPVYVGLEINGSGSPGFIQLHDLSITTAVAKQAGVCFVVDGVVMPPHMIGVLRETTTKSITTLPPKYPPNTFFIFDTPAAGYHTYSLYVTLGSNSLMTIAQSRMIAREF